MKPPIDLDFSRFHQMFLDEAADLLQILESGLLTLERPGQNTEQLNAIFRAAHSIKGNAGMTGWETIANFTHVIEGILDELRTGRRSPEKLLTTNLLQAVDHLKEMLKHPPTQPMTREAQNCLNQLSHANIETEKVTKTTPKRNRELLIDWTPPTDCLIRGVDPLRVLATLSQFGELNRTVCKTDRLPSLPNLRSDVCHLSWLIQLTTQSTIEEISDIFAFQALDEHLSITEYQTDNQPLQAAPTETTPVLSSNTAQHGPPASIAGANDGSPGRSFALNPPSTNAETVRVAAAKLDAIFNLVGEMVITQSMATQNIETQCLSNPDLANSLQELKRQTRELQDRIMGLRLVPVDQVFRRFPRLVHDLSQQLDKNLHLDITGSETEIDRNIVEQINDPLIHLIRNCADHGIETSQQRLAKGKPATGQIRLTAKCQGGSTIVQLEDDGRGIDIDKIRSKGLKIGLLQPHVKYSDKQIQSLIFHPGFSTADELTPISGRGVGMDAVRRSVESISGSISIHSTPGQGSRFTIHLPMTLAILDGLLVSVDKNVLVLPLASVIECKRPKPEDIRNIPDETSNQFRELLVSRSTLVPVFHLRSLFGKTGDNLEHRPEKRARMAILVEHNGHQLALLADEILGQQQVVIKSLETNYKRIEGLQGATILGDGRVALVVDLTALTRSQEQPHFQIPPPPLPGQLRQENH